MVNTIAKQNKYITGYGTQEKLGPNETISYQFSNNINFEIFTNVSMDFNIEFDGEMKDREAAMSFYSNSSLTLQIKSNTSMTKYGLAQSPTSPKRGGYQWQYGYSCIYQLKLNNSVQVLKLRFKKSSQFGLDPNLNHSIAIYDTSSDSWEIISTSEILDTSTSEVYLESTLTALNANTEYYITIYHVEDQAVLWIGIVLILVIGVFSVVIIISKTDYIHFLKTRSTQPSKGAHRLSLDDVLENENRNKIIDIILKEPGIHFNELLRKTELAAGNLIWHLDILETYKVIGKKRIGKFLVYFLYYQKNPLSNIDLKLSKSKVTLEILEMIEKKPGIWNSIITKDKKVDHKTIQYHIKKLMDLDLVTVKKEGRKKKLFPNLDSEYFKKNRNP